MPSIELILWGFTPMTYFGDNYPIEFSLKPPLYHIICIYYGVDMTKIREKVKYQEGILWEWQNHCLVLINIPPYLNTITMLSVSLLTNLENGIFEMEEIFYLWFYGTSVESSLLSENPAEFWTDERLVVKPEGTAEDL